MRRASVLTRVATAHPVRGWGDQLSADGITLTAFAKEHSRGLTAFAYLVCGDRGRAEDLVQDAFIAMYRRFGEFLPLEAPVAYARRAIVNGHVSLARKRITGATVIGPVPDRASDAVDHAEQDAMWRAIATLPDRQRHVLVLRYYVDLSDAEIARTLDCREGTVRSLATRAFSALRNHPELTGEESP